MKKKYNVSPAIAWQSYDCIDLLIILNRGNREFYFFQESGRVIVDYILSGKSKEHILEMCLKQFDVTENFMLESTERFYLLLQQEGIVYECDE